MSKYMIDQKDNSEPLSSNTRDNIDFLIVKLGEYTPEDSSQQITTVEALSNRMSYGPEMESIYTLRSLLDIIDTAPESFKDDTEKEAYLRLGALKAVKRSYEQGLYKDPELNEIIINTLLRRRSKYDKRVRYTTNRQDSHPMCSLEVWQINKFFELIVENEKDPQNLLNIFDCLVEESGIADFLIADKENELMVQMLNNAKRKPDLFLGYLDILQKREERLEYTVKPDYRAQCVICKLYSHIFMKFPQLDHEVRKEIEERVFDRIIETVQEHPDDAIRAQYISPLQNLLATSLPRTKQEDLSQQQERMELNILKTLTEVVREEPSKERGFRYTAHYSAWKTLADMMEIYSKGVINSWKALLSMQENYSEEYEEAFLALTNNLPKEAPFRQESLKSLKRFLNIEILDNPKHPFSESGREFLVDHYSNDIKDS